MFFFLALHSNLASVFDYIFTACSKGGKLEGSQARRRIVKMEYPSHTELRMAENIGSHKFKELARPKLQRQ